MLIRQKLLIIANVLAFLYQLGILGMNDLGEYVSTGKIILFFILLILECFECYCIYDYAKRGEE